MPETLRDILADKGWPTVEITELKLIKPGWESVVGTDDKGIEYKLLPVLKKYNNVPMAVLIWPGDRTLDELMFWWIYMVGVEINPKVSLGPAVIWSKKIAELDTTGIGVWVKE